MTELSKKDITGHNMMMGVALDVPTPNYTRGINRLEGSPEDSAGGMFSFDEQRRSQVTTIGEPTPDSSGGYSSAGSSMITITSSQHSHTISNSQTGSGSGAGGVTHSESSLLLLPGGGSGSNSGDVSMDSSQRSPRSPHSTTSAPTTFGENYRNFVEVTHQFTIAAPPADGGESRQIFNPFLAPQDSPPALESP
jgi:hypothetical protein